MTPPGPIQVLIVDDSALVQRCLNGDSIAIQTLIERFQGEVLGLCVRLLGHRQDAEDVVQEVFLRIFRSLTKWDSERPLRPWIMGRPSAALPSCFGCTRSSSP